MAHISLTAGGQPFLQPWRKFRVNGGKKKVAKLIFLSYTECRKLFSKRQLRLVVGIFVGTSKSPNSKTFVNQGLGGLM